METALDALARRRVAITSPCSRISISLSIHFRRTGGVSTWESLHVGVPVIAKLGNSVSARAAGAILKAVGLDDLVADDDDG